MNIYTLRKYCIFCDSNIENTYFKKDKDIFVTSIICEDDKNLRYKIPYNILICENCGCYQNKYLGNLDLVYGDNHNNNVISKIWVDHYINFFDFIKNSINIESNSKILEVGAGNNFIVNLFLQNGYTNYTILEPVITSRIENVNYINGWLSDYPKDINNDLVILSHVFEHLYEPKELFSIKSKYIGISIPNIPSYMENFILNFLNIEHTFYYEEEQIINFFNNNKYKLVNKSYYTNHSIFYIFKFDDSLESKIYNKNIIYEIISKSNKYFEKIHKLIKKINNYITNNSHKNFAIFPANLYIQYLISMGLNTTKIKYLYDNNINKKDKYLYGTNLICKDLDFLKENSNNEIILLGFLYNDEIIKILEKNKISYYNPCLDLKN